MTFCSKCGQSLAEGNVHECTFVGSSTSTEETLLKKVDFQVLLEILRHPMNCVQLNSSNGGFIYGLIGIGMSVLGFFLFALSLDRIISNSFGGYGIGSALLAQASLGGRSLLIGLLSILALMASYWFVAQFVTKKKLDVKDFTAKIGSFHLIFGVVFMLSAIIAFISMQLAFIILVVAILLALVCTNTLVLQLYNANASQQMKISAGAIGIYTIALMIIMKIVS
ncbi:hypothetical protein PMSD_03910 [Paenibacillus macquariensis subsp. defensor]|nr:hypothetical protein PMSD_03910 [Paenibacillus macquariensis subsp. defensor]